MTFTGPPRGPAGMMNRTIARSRSRFLPRYRNERPQEYTRVQTASLGCAFVQCDIFKFCLPDFCGPKRHYSFNFALFDCGIFDSSFGRRSIVCASFHVLEKPTPNRYIHHDLAPFWGLPPAVLRKESHAYDMTIHIRDQKAKTTSNWFWTEIWLNMTQSIEDMLPDMDLPLNSMDEPRISAPWEEVNRLVEIEKASRKMLPPNEIFSDFQKLPKEPDTDIPQRHKNFSDTRYVSNYTASTDFCGQPDLQALHGMFINPLSVSETKVFAPLFGGSKLPTNNEILLPAPMYWSEEERFTGGGATGGPWNNKTAQVIWRGVATGGKNNKDNWRGFQRHRFVAQTNGTKISNAEAWTEIPENWAMPTTQYNLAAQQDNRLGNWTAEWADTGFVDLMCDPPGENHLCNHTDPYYKILPGIKMAEQFQRKYLPDIDGNSFSGRYRGFLMSTSVPIKATIFREWHDSRLMPWLHFVPMDNRFLDFWGIMEYFLGYKSETMEVPAHDAEGEKIAIAGQDWANKVLRREDMQIYVLRLLLEYGRLNDDRRDNMGFVGDLVDSPA
ncbi:putative Beta-1,2-xylosyltransferase 1 [Glarea lozoyensis 74030]|uniref:Putative Beta-1,2-xylosyltransferase 1 n=1 Tax=Glarea lozoyensis (strain ATCC 74030 / MF5533) TaxID=1104152 RepID=H0EPF3_GLAL7|nr:putative Beta-1,2-xylosyltransferase 1 [Glarea lozoyensis 74030]